MSAAPPIAELLDEGRTASLARDWQSALNIFRLAATHYPARAEGLAGAARALRYLRRFEEAEKLLLPAMTAFPANIHLALEYGWCAITARDWASASARWLAILARFPKEPAVHQAAAHALIEGGRYCEAEILLTTARSSFPAAPEIGLRLIELAVAKQEWNQLRATCDEITAAFPQEKFVLEAAKIARFKADLADDKTTETPAAPIASSSPERDMMMRMESLGNDCEFGLVQRHFDAEPLGLLRWSGIHPSQLVSALESKFAGVGDLEHTQLEVDRGEYRTRDTRFGMWMHTFQSQHSSPPEAFLKSVTKRIRYLRDKLITDLTTGEKLFVYKNAVITDAEAEAILHALRAYGPNRLLCVQLADETTPPGTLRQKQEGLSIGYLSRFANFQPGAMIDFDGWLDLCKRVAP